MKAWGIQMASEVQLRKLSAQQIGTNLTGEMVPFTFVLKNGGGGGEDLRQHPYSPHCGGTTKVHSCIT